MRNDERIVSAVDPTIYLTARLIEIAQKYSTGMRAKAIARDLRIVVHTVYEDMKIMRDRFHAGNNEELIRLLILHGLLPPSR